jgi:hypothetical protein
MSAPKVEERVVKAGDLSPAKYNPRAISEEALDGLRSSIERFGMLQDVVVNEREDGELRVVGGHQRVRALHPDPNDKVRVKVVHLSDIEEKALNLALNSSALQGTWTESLKELIDEVRAEMPDLAADVRIPELEIEVPLFDDGGTGGGEPPGDFPNNEGSAARRCPKCGYEWDGKDQ